MNPDGDPPRPPAHTPFWPRVWTYWVTGGLAVVLAAVIPVLLQKGPFAPNKPTPTASPTTPAPPRPELNTTPPRTTPPTAPTQPPVTARITSIVPLGAVTPTVTKVQVTMTWTGLKGRSGYIKWHTYNDTTKLSMSEDSTISTPALNWDSTDWKPTFIVPTPPVHWQLQVTAFSPEGAQLATSHSNFTFGAA
ncbi:hypothetical protein EKH77_08955 [Streptomyces luteoverticillatus]|uniref:Uncharacterized protein n=1 Tax=Streptomyces luteoverticillatus TaxID=66425 RepID=A0A3Q9FTD0_STRLT|nr:hypothetical protein [Streptomyces luteoverticillatus]AZQ71324.1 hypothetical protein EKH77_08955 [Streptomyces luteoverticillatus]